MTTRVWSDPQWRSGAEAWARDRLAEHGHAVVGPVEQPHAAPWATVLRLPTDHGPFWFKASASGTAYEHRMFGVLADVVPEHVLAPLATDVERAWSLLPDAGTRLRDRLESHPGERFARWEDVVRDHAVLQRALTGTVDRMLALGVPDMRPPAVPDHAAGVLDWLELDGALRARADRWLPSLAEACDALGVSAVPATVQQDDLHDGNVLLDADAPMHAPAYRLVDWGDACVGHPFGVFLILRIALSTRGAVDPHGPELTRVRDAYLEPFTDLATAAELRRDLERAAYVQSIPRLCTWQRALADAAPEEALPWLGELPGWMASLIDEPVPPGR